MVKNPPANAGDVVQSLAQEDPTCLGATEAVCAPQLLKLLCSATTEASAMKSLHTTMERSPLHTTTRESPSTVKIKIKKKKKSGPTKANNLLPESKKQARVFQAALHFHQQSYLGENYALT